MPNTRPNTERKALAVNLDSRRYGSFAEIGAGQEVVRWFFRVGGAAGTIAKSMSAYDMSVSDAIYGHCERYVCRKRLEDMLVGLLQSIRRRPRHDGEIGEARVGEHLAPQQGVLDHEPPGFEPAVLAREPLVDSRMLARRHAVRPLSEVGQHIRQLGYGVGVVGTGVHAKHKSSRVRLELS